MAETASEPVSEKVMQAEKPPPKRRRILDPSAIVPVPIYSNKVNSSLQLKPAAPVFIEKVAETDADADDSLLHFSSGGAKIILGDSEEEEEEEGLLAEVEERTETETSARKAFRCPSPPPAESPTQKQSREVKKKINEIDRKLRAVSSLLSPEPQNNRQSRRRGVPYLPCDVQLDDDDDDVIIIVDQKSKSSTDCSSERQIPLKVRCRTDVHKIPVLSSTPLKDVVAQLSIILKVPAPRLLLLREATELSTDSTVRELGLSITDIIDCVVIAENDDGIGKGHNVITVRLQGKDKNSSQEFSLHREAPLGSIFSKYVSSMAIHAQRKVRFQFDGSKVKHCQTPAQLDMEDGDVIEVWT